MDFVGLDTFFFLIVQNTNSLLKQDKSLGLGYAKRCIFEVSNERSAPGVNAASSPVF